MIKIKPITLEELKASYAFFQEEEKMSFDTNNGEFEMRTNDIEEIIIRAQELRSLAKVCAEKIIEFEAIPEFNKEKNNELMKILVDYYCKGLDLHNWCTDSSLEHHDEIKIKKNKNELLCSFYTTNPRIKGRMRKYAEKYDEDLLYGYL